MVDKLVPLLLPSLLALLLVLLHDVFEHLADHCGFAGAGHTTHVQRTRAVACIGVSCKR
jgi:hypothetical protein